MRRLAPALALCACMLASSCGSGDAPPRQRSVVLRPGGVLRVVAREYSFDPAKAVVARGPLRVVLANRGSLAHDLRVVSGGRELGGTPAFAGGGARSATLRLAPGRYAFICTVGDHAKLGMRGTLLVRR